MMHIAIVEDFVFDQEHLIDLIQKNFEKHGEMADFTCYESGEVLFRGFPPRSFQRCIYGYYDSGCPWTGAVILPADSSG